MRRQIVVGGRSAEEVTPLRLDRLAVRGGRARTRISIFNQHCRVVATAEADKEKGAEKKARPRETRNLLVQILLTDRPKIVVKVIYMNLSIKVYQ